MQLRNKMKIFVYFSISLCIVLQVVECENKTQTENDYGSELIEEGRTLVRNTLKRFMVILPAIFFKLGIAFTLLLIVTLVAANNGFIGFLILVVGLSTVLSRFQTRPTPIIQSLPAPLPLSYAALPQLAHHHHSHPWIDRSDNVDNLQKASKAVNNDYGVSQDNYENSAADIRNTGVYYKNHLHSSAYAN